LWAITGGAAIAGDDSYSACLREVKEEIGIQADMEKAKVVFTLNREVSICDVWLIQQDFRIEECILQEEEVSEVKWASPQEIKNMVEQGIFHNYQYLYDLFSITCKL
jgi:8-oxo-dGTP pyrophosphatase MutT (NUDIX family)